MVKHTLVAASALALVLSAGVSGLAFAKSTQPPADNGGANTAYTLTGDSATAASVQSGSSVGSSAMGSYSGNILGSVNGTGLINAQQNGGANSTVQDSNTLGAILNETGPANVTTGVSESGTLALSTQVAFVAGATSEGDTVTSGSSGNGSGYHDSSSAGGGFSKESGGGHEQSSGGGFQESSGGGHSNTVFDNNGKLIGQGTNSGGGGQEASGGGHEQSSGGGFSNESGGFHSSSSSSGYTYGYNNWNNSATYDASENVLTSINGTGMINVSQNVGNNSVLQSSNTAAALVNGVTLP